MAESMMTRSIGGTGLTLKRVAVVGVSGGLTLGISDYWVERWIDAGATEDEQKTQERKRALLQVGLGVGVAYLVKGWSRDVAIGAAVGGVAGGAKRLWDSEGLADRFAEMFDDDTAPAPNPNPNPGRAGGRMYGLK